MSQIIFIFKHIESDTAVTVRAGSREEAFDFIKSTSETPNQWEVIDSFIAPHTTL